MTQIQKDNFREILAWLRGGDVTPDPQMEDKFIDTITGMVMERMNIPAQGLSQMQESETKAVTPPERPKPISIKAVMRELTGDPNYEIPRVQVVRDEPQEQNEPSNDTKTISDELDSVLVARTFIHLARSNNHFLNISQIQIMTYIAYGVYLVRMEKRLTDEHPQMWEYGPVFPKAYNRLRKNPDDNCDEEIRQMMDSRPEVYDLLTHCFHKYAWRTATALSAPHTEKGSPWAMTRKANPDKWGAQIDDEVILQWFKERM